MAVFIRFITNMVKFKVLNVILFLSFRVFVVYCCLSIIIRVVVTLLIVRRIILIIIQKLSIIFCNLLLTDNLRLDISSCLFS